MHGILIDTFIRLSALPCSQQQQKRYWFQNQDVNTHSFISAPIFILFPHFKTFFLKESDNNYNSIIIINFILFAIHDTYEWLPFDTIDSHSLSS